MKHKNIQSMIHVWGATFQFMHGKVYQQGEEELNVDDDEIEVL